MVFFEGHDQAGVQDALNSFAERCRSELKGHLKSRYFVLWSLVCVLMGAQLVLLCCVCRVRNLGGVETHTPLSFY